MLMWAMSDRAIPRSYRTMQGFGVHTFRFVNAAGESHFVKFHWNADGRHALAGVGRSGQDLRRRSRLPPPRPLGGDRGRRLSRSGSWACRSSPRSRPRASPSTCSTRRRSCPEELVPVFPVGKLVLNRNPDNFFAETEQVAFCVAHVVPGIDFTQRSAARRPHPLLRRHPDLAARRPELPRDPDQRADRAGPQQPARRHAPPGHQPRPRRLRAELARRRLSVPGRARWASCRSRSRARPTITRSAASRSASPTTTPRRRCSGTARRRSRRRTSSRRSASSCRRCRRRRSASAWCPAC